MSNVIKSRITRWWFCDPKNDVLFFNSNKPTDWWLTSCQIQDTFSRATLVRLRFCAKFFYSGEVPDIIRRFLDLYVRTHLFKFSFDIDFCCLCYIEIHWSFNFGMYIKHALSCLLQSNFLRGGEMLFEIFKKPRLLYFKQHFDAEDVILQQPRDHGNKIELI